MVAKFLARIWSVLPFIHWPVMYAINPKYVIGTNVIITNDQGQIWLQKHRFWPEYPWGLPGGHLKANETPEQGIIREIREELSAELELDGVVAMENHHTHGLVIYFYGSFLSEVGTIDPFEIEQAQYFDLDQLPDQLFPRHRQLIQTYLARTSV